MSRLTAVDGLGGGTSEGSELEEFCFCVLDYMPSVIL